MIKSHYIFFEHIWSVCGCAHVDLLHHSNFWDWHKATNSLSGVLFSYRIIVSQCLQVIGTFASVEIWKANVVYCDAASSWWKMLGHSFTWHENAHDISTCIHTTHKCQQKKLIDKNVQTSFELFECWHCMSFSPKSNLFCGMDSIIFAGPKFSSMACMSRTNVLIIPYTCMHQPSHNHFRASYIHNCVAYEMYKTLSTCTNFNFRHFG